MKRQPKTWKRRKARQKAAANKGDGQGLGKMSGKIARLLRQVRAVTGIQMKTLKKSWKATPVNVRGTMHAGFVRRRDELRAAIKARKK